MPSRHTTPFRKIQAHDSSCISRQIQVIKVNTGDDVNERQGRRLTVAPCVSFYNHHLIYSFLQSLRSIQTSKFNLTIRITHPLR
ncbi:hypothetical protein L1987_73978 [Smallanthus sonchifolius]|uniref:Uncharacterized protein n=1 Tax=Smallanthus sonchifolius TaxID=185202 RepID=A0ACB9A1P1_9ASTR|nr:hypothetical protein L1987_73978 [Smallanthus sonchifolius]